MILMVNRLFKSIIKYARGVSFSSFVLFFTAIFIVFINPAANFFRPRCLIREITGFYCAGCGMSTGLHALLRCDIQGAMERNILIVTLMPAALIYMIIRKFILQRNNKNKYRFDLFVIILFIIVVLSFTVCRNIPLPIFEILRPH